MAFAYTNHLSRRDCAALRDFIERANELKAAGEELDYYADIVPLLVIVASDHYEQEDEACEAVRRLTAFIDQHFALLDCEGQGRA